MKKCEFGHKYNGQFCIHRECAVFNMPKAGRFIRGMWKRHAVKRALKIRMEKMQHNRSLMRELRLADKTWRLQHGCPLGSPLA